MKSKVKHEKYADKIIEIFTDQVNALEILHDLNIGVFDSIQNVQIYDHPVYKQYYEPFVPYLSIIDLLFGYGKESVDVIAQTHRMNDCSDVV